MAPSSKTTRRGFLIGAASALLAAATWRLRLLRELRLALAGTSEGRVVRLLCGRLLPEDATHPGALSLGLDRLILERAGDSRRQKERLRGLIDALVSREFHRMTEAGQTGLLAELFASGGPASRSLMEFHRALVRLYYVQPEAWKSLGYRKPQPDGYPEFNRCGPA